MISNAEQHRNRIFIVLYIAAKQVTSLPIENI